MASSTRLSVSHRKNFTAHSLDIPSVFGCLSRCRRPSIPATNWKTEVRVGSKATHFSNLAERVSSRALSFTQFRSDWKKNSQNRLGVLISLFPLRSRYPSFEKWVAFDPT